MLFKGDLEMFLVRYRCVVGAECEESEEFSRLGGGVWRLGLLQANLEFWENVGDPVGRLVKGEWL